MDIHDKSHPGKKLEMDGSPAKKVEINGLQTRRADFLARYPVTFLAAAKIFARYTSLFRLM